MLLEDSINLRHELSYFISTIFYDGMVGSYAWRTSNFRAFIEIIFYAFVGSIMALAFYFIYLTKNSFTYFIKYLISGYIIYGVAAFASATRNIGDWYSHVGTIILDKLTVNAGLEWEARSIIFYEDPLSFWFMDLVIEESLELIGASLILCGLILIFIVKNMESKTKIP